MVKQVFGQLENKHGMCALGYLWRYGLKYFRENVYISSDNSDFIATMTRDIYEANDNSEYLSKSLGLPVQCNQKFKTINDALEYYGCDFRLNKDTREWEFYPNNMRNVLKGRENLHKELIMA